MAMNHSINETYAQARVRLVREFQRLGFRTSKDWVEPIGAEFRIWFLASSIRLNQHPIYLDYRDLSARSVLDHVQAVLLK